MAGIEEFKEAMQKIDSSIQHQVHRFLANWAADVKTEAMRTVPVRTGYLRSTIYAKVQEWVVDIGADASYALFVELGTKYMQAHPYLYPPIQEYLPQLESVVIASIEQAKVEAGL